jgi:hypothetical protein
MHAAMINSTTPAPHSRIGTSCERSQDGVDRPPEEGTPPAPYWIYDPNLRAAEAHARAERLRKHATEKAEAERHAATREYKEAQEQVLERKAQHEARLATNPLFRM